ncbi:MAG: ATP-grasp domain-containing protein [Pseudomonadota bacterium]
MTQTVLLTLGRLPKALELARALNGAGARVVVADPFRRHLCTPSRAVARNYRVAAPRADAGRFRADLARIIADEGVDVIVPVSEEAPYVAALSSEALRGARLSGPVGDARIALHDKKRFIDLAVDAGLDAPKTALLGDARAAEIAGAADFIMKPRFGSSGAGLKFCARGARLPAADDGTVVQERVRGREISSLSVCRDGRVVGTVLYRGLVFAGTVAVCFERVTAPAASAWIEAFVAARGYDGFIAFDFIETADGRALPIECNPRLTSGIHFFDPAGLAAAVLDDAPPASVGFKPHRRMQEGHTTLTKVYGGLPDLREFARRFVSLLTARDVLFSLKDPGPFVLMTPMSWELLAPVMFRGMSFGEAATQDIAWDGAPEATRPSA